MNSNGGFFKVLQWHFVQASACSSATTPSPLTYTFYFFTPLRTRRQKFTNSLESRGFSADHPHATYINVLKFLIFGGGGQQTRQLINFWIVLDKKIKSISKRDNTHSSPYPLLANSQEGGYKHEDIALNSTLPLHSLQLRDGCSSMPSIPITRALENLLSDFWSLLRSLRILSLNPKSRQRCWHAFGRSGFWKTLMCSGRAGTLALTRTTREDRVVSF
jgi:hypothetical protein